MVHRGYSPEIMVFWKQSRLPGSILSDTSLPAHTAALQEEDADISNESFRQTLRLREVARQAFHTADSSNALRRARLRRSCPSRGHYTSNQWVMIWRTVGPQKKGWIGPHRVIIQDADHTIWTTVGGRLYRSAPENVRLSLPEEGEPSGPELPEDPTQIQQQIDRMVRNPDAMRTIPEHEQAIPMDEPSSSPNHHPSSEQGNFSRLQSQTSESVIQPDRSRT